MNEKTLPKISRWLLGIMLIVFGLNTFLQFMPALEGSAGANAFFAAMSATGYFLPVLGITKLVVGLMLVTKKAVPLALVIFAPVSVHIVLFHLFLDPATILMALVVAILNLYLGIKHMNAYRPMFK